MGSLIEELGRREAAARAGADRLRTRIEELSEDLARAEEQVSRLVIAREEVARVLAEPVAEPPAGQNGGPGGRAGPASPIGAVTAPLNSRKAWRRRCCRSRIGTCWKWRPTRGARLRAGEFAAAAGLGAGKAKVEGVRSPMAACCAVPPDDPFAVSRGMFDGLTAELAGPAAAVLTDCELEGLLDERGREVIRQLLQDHYDLRAAREEQRAGSSALPRQVPTGSPGPGWRPGTSGCWPPCSARSFGG